MAVILYREGNTSKVRGIKCEARMVNEYNFADMLEAGWVLSPQELYKEKEAEKETPEVVGSEWPERIGGAWYMLSDGNKVNGEAKAIAAQAELNK